MIVPAPEYSFQVKCDAWKHKPRWVRKDWHRENELRKMRGKPPLKKQIECTCRNGGV